MGLKLTRRRSKISIFLFLDIIEAKILGSNLIYTHHWTAGDMLVLNNVAHIAGPGSQGSVEITGLRYDMPHPSAQTILFSSQTQSKLSWTKYFLSRTKIFVPGSSYLLVKRMENDFFATDINVIFSKTILILFWTKIILSKQKVMA